MLTKMTSKIEAVPPKGFGRTIELNCRAVGGALDAVTMQEYASAGLTVAFAGSTGQYTFTVATRNGFRLACAHPTFEGASAKTCKIESTDSSAGTVTVTVQDGALLDVTLAADEYINLTIKLVSI